MPKTTPTPLALDFASVFEHSPNSYMVLDRELRFVAANRAYLRVTASTLEELVGRHVLDVFPHDADDPRNESARMLHDSLHRVLETGEVDFIALIPYRVPIERNGETVVEERFWSATHMPIVGADGRVAFVLQHTVDVTELHALKRASAAAQAQGGAAIQAAAGVLVRAERVQQANVQLDEERRQLRALFQQAPGFMCFMRGPAHVFDLANDAYFALVGGRDIIGKPVLEALPEVAGQGFVEKLDQVFATGEPFVGRGIRARLQRRAGEPDDLLLDFVYQPIVGADGDVVGIFVQGHDITQQRRLQSQLEAMLYQQRFLAEAIPQQIWTAMADGRLDFVNARVIDYFGESERRIIGEGWQAFVHPDDLPACLERWRACTRTGETYEVEFRLRRNNGEYRWHLARAVPMRDASGRVTKWFGTNTDVDDVKRAQDELQRRAAFDQQLIGIVSHDLRNPLNAIAMATSLLLKRGHLDDQQGKIVARIISSSERATRLIRDFLDFTQARSAGRLPIAPRAANIRDIAHQVFDEVRLMHAERAATIAHHGEDTGVWDPDRLAQLIGNLVGNAFQYGTDEGRVQVVTRGSEEELTIEVQNDGAPIDQATLARLFEPFQRGTRGSTRSGSSVGLGLFIAKQIVDAHRGTITVTSTPETGTVFTVRLPRNAS